MIEAVWIATFVLAAIVAAVHYGDANDVSEVLVAVVAMMGLALAFAVPFSLTYYAWVCLSAMGTW